MIGVGMPCGTPPSEPYVRISRIRLSSWWVTLNGTALTRLGELLPWRTDQVC